MVYGGVLHRLARLDTLNSLRELHNLLLLVAELVHLLYGLSLDKSEGGHSLDFAAPPPPTALLAIVLLRYRCEQVVFPNQTGIQFKSIYIPQQVLENRNNKSHESTGEGERVENCHSHPLRRLHLFIYKNHKR